jgi:hypothetical protein
MAWYSVKKKHRSNFTFTFTLPLEKGTLDQLVKILPAFYGI